MTAEGELRIRLAAPASEGKANRELVSFLSRLLDIAPSRLALVRGMTGRHKVIEIDGVDEEDVLQRLRESIPG